MRDPPRRLNFAICLYVERRSRAITYDDTVYSSRTALRSTSIRPIRADTHATAPTIQELCLGDRLELTVRADVIFAARARASLPRSTLTRNVLLHHGPGCFVRLTGINRAVVGIQILAVIAILNVLLVQVVI
jgi:hypothetical protein